MASEEADREGEGSLVNTTASLREISLETGFPDQSHFTRVFSQLEETSPAVWRKARLS
jgi:AraC family transcriptional regulator